MKCPACRKLLNANNDLTENEDEHPDGMIYAYLKWSCPWCGNIVYESDDAFEYPEPLSD